MKWFHHECAARHDPKLQILGATHRAEGLGIFWGLLEEIGHHSDTFHLKILGISEEIDQRFLSFLQEPLEKRKVFGDAFIDPGRIPRLPMKILAKNLFTTRRRLVEVINTCVGVGLFDSRKWSEFNVLHSSSFEQRADDYTRRLQRRHTLSTGEASTGLRTLSEQHPNTVPIQAASTPDSSRTKSEKESPETEAEQIQIRERTDSETEVLVIHAGDVNKLSTTVQQGSLSTQSGLVDLSEEELEAYCNKFRLILASWNEEGVSKFDWNPTDTELRKLFYGGERNHKVDLCYLAYNLLGENVHYAEIVLRALRLMLRASEKTRIVNPLGWMWTCLHGNGDGTPPWVQLLAADEERSLRSPTRRRFTRHEDQ
jgi:hypothetical protein